MNTRPLSIRGRRPIPLAGAASVLLLGGPAAGAQVAIPTVDVREEIRIASNEAVPEMRLTGVDDLAVLPDGRIVTGHYREAVARVFDPNGRLLTVLGRRGQGPGEFTRVSQVGYVGERIWVRDQARGYQLFDARTYEPLRRLVQRPAGGGSSLGLTSDSTSFFHRQSPEDSARIGIFNRAGELRRAIELPLRRAGHHFEIQMPEIVGGGFLSGRMVPRTMYSPLAVATALRAVPGGREVIVLEASELWNGPPGQFTIRRIETATGRITPPVTVALPVRRVTPSEADSLIKASTSRLMGPRDVKPAEEYRAKARVPAVYPAFMSVTPSADGVLWLTEYASPDTRLVVDLTGKPLMRVRLPKNFRVLAVSRTHVWGVALDADDLPIISRYRVQR